MRTIIAVFIGFCLVACSEEKEQSRIEEASFHSEKIADKAPVNHFLGCWEERKDTNVIYWCFDSSTVNRDGYIYPYLFEGEQIEIAAISYAFSFSSNDLSIINIIDSSKLILVRSSITESPNAF